MGIVDMYASMLDEKDEIILLKYNMIIFISKEIENYKYKLFYQKQFKKDTCIMSSILNSNVVPFKKGNINTVRSTKEVISSILQFYFNNKQNLIKSSFSSYFHHSYYI